MAPPRPPRGGRRRPASRYGDDEKIDYEALASVGPVETPPDMESFDELDLSPIMRRALKTIGFDKPSPVQAAVIPHALAGRDVIGQARTGTGKTAAFSIPILEQLDSLEECRDPQAIVIVPTRELADQVAGEARRISVGLPTEIAVLAGGKNLNGQLRQLENGVQMVVGTPGRMHDHLQRGTLRTGNAWCVVLDEADRMLDIGFRPQIERILRKCPRQRQTLLLSATLPSIVRRLAESYMTNPVVIDCSSTEMSVETIEQHYFTVDQDRKGELLCRLLRREDPEQAIVFCRTKRGTDRLGRELARDFGNRVACMHGDMQQRERDRTLQRLRDGDLQILVATDVVGRGIDITTISHIVNYDVPEDSDDYVHRVGRTGRMGRDGVAFTFIEPGQGEFLTSIEARINKLLVRETIDDFETVRRVEIAKPVEDDEPATKSVLNPMHKKVRRRR